MPVRFSGLGRPNQIARERARLAAAGVPVTDLTDSNPTRHGLGSPAVLEAVARAAGRAALYDPSPRGPLPAREALAARYGGHPDDYWLTASTSEAYSWLLQLLTDPGDRVAIPAPGYPLIEPLAALALARTRAYPLYYLHPSGWEHDTGRLAELAAQPGVRAVIAVHPGNPTGAYVECGARLHEICARTDCALISDEVFRPFTVDRAAAPASLADQGEALTFALDGLSKTLAAPQLKLGWIRVAGPADRVAAVAPLLDQIADTFLSVNGPVGLALPELLGLADTVIADVRRRLATNVATLRELLAGEASYRVRRVDGGWTALVDVPPVTRPGGAAAPGGSGGIGHGENGHETDPDAAADWLELHLLRHAHLAVHPGWFYDLPGDRTLALSLLPRPDQFRDSVTRLRDAIGQLL